MDRSIDVPRPDHSPLHRKGWEGGSQERTHQLTSPVWPGLPRSGF
jgi:hypothetical protein